MVNQSERLNRHVRRRSKRADHQSDRAKKDRLPRFSRAFAKYELEIRPCIFCYTEGWPGSADEDFARRQSRAGQRLADRLPATHSLDERRPITGGRCGKRVGGRRALSHRGAGECSGHGRLDDAPEKIARGVSAEKALKAAPIEPRTCALAPVANTLDLGRSSSLTDQGTCSFVSIENCLSFDLGQSLGRRHAPYVPRQRRGERYDREHDTTVRSS